MALCTIQVSALAIVFNLLQGVKIVRRSLQFCITDYSHHENLYKDFPGIL
jgi:hypothetical protein